MKLIIQGICPAGTTGIFCGTIINLCPSYCLNNGTCYSPALNSFKCSCSNQFTGSKCQYPISPCISNPCVNAGICVANAGQYFCNCLPGFTGKICDQVSRF